LSDEIDIAHLAFIRIGKEPSKACPADFYRNPAHTVKLQSELSCDRCLYSRPGKAGLFCGKGQQYGKHCEFFRKDKK